MQEGGVAQRPRQRPRTLAGAAFRLTLVALGVGLAIVGFACGFDGEGTVGPPEVVPDSSPVPEASLIPKADGSGLPDAPVSDAPAPRACPVGLPGPTMIAIPDSGTCIDSTEVTNAEYDAFLLETSNGALDAGYPDGGLPAACLAPPASGGITTFLRTGSPDGGGPRRPVGRVSWCQAYGYCVSVGKRLCGGPAAATKKNGEWYSACSNNGASRFPYGDAHVDGLCNDTPGGGVVPVGSLRCEGGLPGLVDMTGNVQEWVSTCDDLAGKCDTAGGSFNSGPASSDCPEIEPLPRAFAQDINGIRCCADVR